MGDRTLLELAALAIGDRYHYATYKKHLHTEHEHTLSGKPWNPLEDDGDALRLAVKLGFTVKVDNKSSFSWVKGFASSGAHVNDPYAATRRAIVRAAAEIGKRIKEGV